MILLQPSQNALGVAYLFMSVGDSAGEQLIIQRDIYYYNPVHKAILSLSLSLWWWVHLSDICASMFEH